MNELSRCKHCGLVIIVNPMGILHYHQQVIGGPGVTGCNRHREAFLKIPSLPTLDGLEAEPIRDEDIVTKVLNKYGTS